MYRTFDNGVKRTKVLVIYGGKLNKIGHLDLKTTSKLQDIVLAAKCAQLRNNPCLYLLPYTEGNKESEKVSRALEVFIKRYDTSKVFQFAFNEKEVEEVIGQILMPNTYFLTKKFVLD